MIDEESKLAFRMITSYGHESLGVRHSIDVLFGTKMLHLVTEAKYSTSTVCWNPWIHEVRCSFWHDHWTKESRSVRQQFVRVHSGRQVV